MLKHKFDFSELEINGGVKRIGELNPYITLACDLRCDYCYMYPFLQKARNITEVMSRGFLDELVCHFVDTGSGLDRLTLLGGEPTLHPEITDMVNDLAEMPIRELRMTTNGTSLHYLELDRLKQNAFAHVSVSIDGIAADVNDATRGKGSFHRIIRTMSQYVQAGVRLSANYTVTNINVDSLLEVARFFRDIGVSIVNFHRASMSGNAYKRPELIVNARQWVAVRDGLLLHIRKNRSDYPGMSFRVPYIFLEPGQLTELGYKPIQIENYHSPLGGHRLIVLPPTRYGRGLCYMSSDLIGESHAELGHLDSSGAFQWNYHPSNELIAFRSNPATSNISTMIVGQETFEHGSAPGLLRVSHSFKETIVC
jgi:MoaA/NifB/PqqE/SkfB family radical SAM enzyme